MKSVQSARAVVRRPLFLLALAAVAVVAAVAAVSLRTSPPVQVRLEVTPRAQARLAETGQPICLVLNLSDPAAVAPIGLRRERQCMFAAGDVAFRRHPYRRTPGASLVVEASSFDGNGDGRHDYACDRIALPLGEAAYATQIMRCDLP